MNLIPWEPFEGMTPLREALNRLFEESFVGLGRYEPFGRMVPLDVREAEKEYVIEASLPGIKPEELTITATDSGLTIHAEKKVEEKEKKEKKDKEETYLRHERFTGELTRSVTFPTRINPEQIAATYEHGVLTLHVPKVEVVKPKTIQVQVKEKRPAGVS